MSQPVRPPKAQKTPHEVTLHGETRVDDYAWLRDEKWKEVMKDPSLLSPDIRDYLDAENSYVKQVMAPEKELRTTLFEEMKGRIKEDDSSTPAKDGPYFYYDKYRKGGQHEIYCRAHVDAPEKEEVLLDGDEMSKGTSYFNIGDSAHSPNHERLAYSIDDNGSEFYTLYVLDLRTREQLSPPILNTAGSAEWANDNKTIFYTLLNENHRSYRIMRHLIGSDPKDDVIVYEEPDSGFFVGVDKTQSGRFILINSHDHETSEIHTIPADNPESAPTLIEPRHPKIEYEIEDQGEQFIIHTNSDAEDYKISTVPIASPARDNWQDLIPHQQGTLILSYIIYKDYMVRTERVNGLPRIVISHMPEGRIEDEHQISFDEEAYSLGIISGYEYDTETTRFTYSSPTTPSQTFDYNIRTRDRELRKTQEVPSGHEPTDYVTKRFMAPAHDGEEVPVTVLYKRDTKLDGSAPCLLYGYGSYGHAMPASFGTSRLSLVDRGFVYAIAHIRGGMDKGYRWYKDGKLEKKENTFRDFIAAGKALVELGYTSKGRIIGHGGSAGGMLMGAVANMAPDLFLGLIAEVPFVDVLNTMCDDTLPLTPPEWPEWGNPIEDKAAYDTIKSYSPYDNVSAQNYPHMFVNAGLTDPRVTYWEPAKWVAKLRDLKTDDNILIFETNMDAGHGGASGRFDALKEVALNYAFALKIAKSLS